MELFVRVSASFWALNVRQATQAMVFPLGQKKIETRDTYADC